MATKKKKMKFSTKKLRRLIASKLPSKSNAQPVARKRKKRKLRKELVFGLAGALALIIAIFLIITIPKYNQNKKLKELGYTKEDITAIREMKLHKTLIETNLYSEYLASCIKDGTVRTDYLPYYTVQTAEDPLSEDDVLLIHRLRDKEYDEEQILQLFRNLKFYEITPLLVFDRQSDVTPYVDDVKNHRDTNNPGYFVLSGDYYTHYENTRHTDETNLNMLVNKTFYLSDTYTPEPLVELSVQVATKGIYLQQEAAEAFTEFCMMGNSLGLRMYAASSYRDYAKQETLYNNYVNSMGQEQADALSARPGFSEHQTGLTVDLAAISADGISEYKDTMEFQWSSVNCYDYGFILRYPEGKSQITGYSYESWHYRYVGKDLAQKVAASQLTYDEYYVLYLKGWDNEVNTYPKPTATPAAQ